MSDVITYNDMKSGDWGNYYRIDTRCGNCGDENTRYLPKGVSQDGQTTPCDKCGCVVRFRSRESMWKP